MPFHDLNVVHDVSQAGLNQTLLFLHELGYSTVAVALTITGKLPPTPPSVSLPSIGFPSSFKFLTRLTLTVSDPSQNHRLASLQSHYDILALRPTTEKALGLCCTSLECEIISLDLSQRLPFILKFKTVSVAIKRGIRFEICYSSGIGGGGEARRNLITGATALIRATRGRGIIVSSEARSALGCRAPWDVINLAQVWGLGQERGKEALCEEASKVVRLAQMKRRSYRGVIDVIDGVGQTRENAPDSKDEVPEKMEVEQAHHPEAAERVVVNGVKRKASSNSIAATPANSTGEKPLSKRQMKKQAKRAKTRGEGMFDEETPQQAETDFPIKHEALLKKNG